MTHWILWRTQWIIYCCLLLIAYFLSLCSFSWLAGNVVKWKYKNSPGLDLCSWLYHYISTVWLRSSALRCGWLASRRLGATSCDRMLTTTGIKCRWFYYIVRSTRQLTLKITSSLPSETCRLLDYHLWSWVNCGEHANHSLKSIDVDGEWISTLTHLYAMVTWNDLR